MKPTYEQLEQQLAAVVAENAGLTNFIKDDCWIWDDKSEEYFDAGDCIPETPATDAAIANLRAQGVEMAIDHIVQTICPNHETILREFAAQLRQGAEHE